MSEDEYGTGIRPRIADGLPNDVNLLILDHLYPVSLIRAAYAGYPVPAEWVRRALHTYLWKRVLVVQFDSVKARIREGENIFLIGYGLERLTCGIFEEADEAPTIKLLLEKPRIDLALYWNAIHRGLAVDDLSKYLKKDTSGIWTKIAYLYKKDWKIDTVEVKMKVMQAGKDRYWFKYEFEIQHKRAFWGLNERLHMT